MTKSVAMTRIEPDIELARMMFRELETGTRVGRGITRTSYGAGENFAHALARRVAEELGLAVPGADRNRAGGR